MPVRNVKGGLTRDEHFAPGTILRVQVDAQHPVGFGMPVETYGFYNNSPFFTLVEGFASQRPTVVARYPNTDVVASGWLRGEDLMAGRAAVVSIDMNPGRVVLFGLRPQHRAQTHATFPLLFNALYLSTAEGTRRLPDALGLEQVPPLVRRKNLQSGADGEANHPDERVPEPDAVDVVARRQADERAVLLVRVQEPREDRRVDLHARDDRRRRFRTTWRRLDEAPDEPCAEPAGRDGVDDGGRAAPERLDDRIVINLGPLDQVIEALADAPHAGARLPVQLQPRSAASARVVARSSEAVSSAIRRRHQAGDGSVMASSSESYDNAGLGQTLSDPGLTPV